MARPYTLLIVDDEPQVREVLGQSLEAFGFVVLMAYDAYEAVRLLSDRMVDVLITDVRMPEVNGFELARQAKLMRPSLHVIYISGHFTKIEHGDGPTYGLLMHKP